MAPRLASKAAKQRSSAAGSTFNPRALSPTSAAKASKERTVGRSSNLSPGLGNQAALRRLSKQDAGPETGPDTGRDTGPDTGTKTNSDKPVLRRDPANGKGADTNVATSQNSSLPLPPQCANANSSSAACQPPVDYATLAWPQLLPGTHGINGAQIAKIDLHTPGNDFRKWGTGADPTLNYSAPAKIKTDPASAEPQGGMSGTTPEAVESTAQNTAFQAAQDKAVAAIIDARSKIPVHSMPRSQNNNAGYDYNPTKDPAAADYLKWESTALPAGVKATDWNWQVFKKIQGLEGQEGRFTTFDKTLSVGPGYSTSGGQTQQVLGKTFKILPEVAKIAFDAGLTVDLGGAMAVVDPQKRWILNGQDAAAYLQTDTSLLSLLVNVSQGTQPVDPAQAAPSGATAGTTAPAAGTAAPDEQSKQRQGLLEAEWAEFVGVTLNGLTGMVKGWPIDSAVLAVHAKHGQPGNFPYGFWDSHSDPSLAAMVQAISDKVGASASFIASGIYAKFLPKAKPPDPKPSDG